MATPPTPPTPAPPPPPHPQHQAAPAPPPPPPPPSPGIAPRAGRHSPVVDDPPGKDGYQGQRLDAEFPPVPDYAPGTNPPGTNPPVSAAHDPALTPIPGMIPGLLLDQYPHADKQPTNASEEARRSPQQVAHRGGPPG